jgi:3-oxoacyl-[acyl-carrier-protein] synthase II
MTEDRDGFVMGEGAGVVVLEELEHALARGAKIYAEVVGYGLSGDAFHITALRPKTARAPNAACAGAEARRHSRRTEIDYINAHGTSTMADTIELGAVERLVGDACAEDFDVVDQVGDRGICLVLPVRAEAIFSTLAIRDNIAPPTLNLDNPDVSTKIDLVPHKARNARSTWRCRTPSDLAEPTHRWCLKRYTA